MQRTEENNRTGKTGDFLKKRRDTKGTFQAKMGTMDLREAENTKKSWQEYTELYIYLHIHIHIHIHIYLNDPGNHDSVIIHLEPDILECKVKWRALGSITTN